jgi:hypothetical protein
MRVTVIVGGLFGNLGSDHTLCLMFILHILVYLIPCR